MFLSTISLILFIVLLYTFHTTEHFVSDRNYKKYNKQKCDDVIPIVPLNCNRVPNFPKEFEPKKTKLNYKYVPFNRLAPKNGKYTFYIPELKYDGIFSRKINNKNYCSWSNDEKKLETYGANNLLQNITC